MKKSFILYVDHLSVLDELTDEQAGQLFKAINTHVQGGDIALSGLLNAVFIPFKNQIDRDLEKWEVVRKRNVANGKKGGRPKTQKNPENPVGYLETQNNPEKPVTVTVTANVNGNENVNVHGLSNDLWVDFQSLRKKKKKRVTQRVMDGIKREAHSIGWTMDKAVTEVLENEWQSFKAEYIDKSRHKKPKKTDSYTHDEFQEAINKQLENIQCK